MGITRAGTKKFVSIALAAALGLSIMPTMGLINNTSPKVIENIIQKNVAVGTDVNTNAKVSVLGDSLDDYIDTLGNYSDLQKKKWEDSKASTHKMRNVMYYGDWSVWGGQGNYKLGKVPARYLTHLNYAFASPKANGDINIIDKSAFSGDNGFTGGSSNDGKAGGLSGMRQLRAINPNLRIGTSFGGWSLGGNFHGVLSDPIKRSNFIQNLIRWTRYMDGDFIDLDWEYPAYVRDADNVDNKNDQGTPECNIPGCENSNDYVTFITFLKELRAEVDKAGIEDGKYYELSAATPAGKAKCDAGMDLPNIYKYLDFVNVMTYDLHGAFDRYSGHQTGLYRNPYEEQMYDSKADYPHLDDNGDPARNTNGDIITVDERPYGAICKEQNLSVSESVEYYLTEASKPFDKNKPNEKFTRAEVAAKTVVGVAMYTRGWQDVRTNGQAKDKEGNSIQPKDRAGNDLPGLFASAKHELKDADYTTESYGAQNHADLSYGDSGRHAGNWGFGLIQNESGNSTTKKLGYKYSGLTEYWDDWAQAPYLYNGKSFFTYDNERSIKAKGDFVKGKRMNADGVLVDGGEKLGGLISWMASNDKQDDGSWNGGGERVVLTRACKEALFGVGDDIKIPTKDIVTHKRNISANLMSSGSSQKLSITNVGLNDWPEERDYEPDGSYNAEGMLEDNFNCYPNPRITIKGNFSATSNKTITNTKQNGYTIIDISDAFSRGTTIDLMLKCQNSGCKSVFHDTDNEVSSATIEYTIVPEGGYKHGKQSIFQRDWSITKPVIIGVGDTQINKGEDFDPQNGVMGIEPEDESRLVWHHIAGTKGTIHVEGSVKNDIAGRYELIYTAVSRHGPQKIVVRYVDVVETGSKKPVFSGVKDITIPGWHGINKDGNSTFSVLEGITAKDRSGRDLTSRITYKENGFSVKTDNKKRKIYLIEYNVTDNDGNVAEPQSRTITVLPLVDWTVSKAYPKFSKVAHLNHAWIADYNLQRTEPGKKGTEKYWIDLGEISSTKPAPIFNGIVDKEIDINSSSSQLRDKALEGVSVTYDGRPVPNSEIQIDSTFVKMDQEDDYVIVYSVTVDGQTEMTTCKITVVDRRPLPKLIVDDRTREIAINGTIAQATAKALEGVSATCNGEDVTDKISVDTRELEKVADAQGKLNQTGTYEITYSVTVNGKTAGEIGSIEVVTNSSIPTFSGVKDITVTLGDTTFDETKAKEDVKASYIKNGVEIYIPKNKIIVNLGKFDKDIADNYTITYSIAATAEYDSTSATCVVHVVDNEPFNVGWRANRIYLSGEILSGEKNGTFKYYKARVWNVNKEPSTNSTGNDKVWEEISLTDILAMNPVNYVENTRYRSLTIVRMSNGDLYQTTRFTNTHPVTNGKGWRKIVK